MLKANLVGNIFVSLMENRFCFVYNSFFQSVLLNNSFSKIQLKQRAAEALSNCSNALCISVRHLDRDLPIAATVTRQLQDNAKRVFIDFERISRDLLNFTQDGVR